MRLMLVVVLLLAACTTAPPSPQFTAPVWTRQSLSTLPYERLGFVRAAAGWNGGFVVAGEYYESLPPSSEPAFREFLVLHVSADGETWREMPLEGIQSFALGHATAGYGDRGYVLGNNEEGPVLLTIEGDAATRLSLPGANAEDKAVSVAAGPHGVVVVALVNQVGAVSDEAKIWYSADGRTFASSDPVSDTTISDSDAAGLAATDRGFLLPVSDVNVWAEHGEIQLSESVDGRVWMASGAGFPQPPSPDYLWEIRAAQHNNGVTVAFGATENRETDAGPSPLAWYRRDGETTWTRLELDPGKLPDAGVGPPETRNVYEVFPWRTGFLALGSTGEAAAVWTSPDGVKWSKMPVRDNGLESAGSLRFMSNGRTSLMLQQSPLGHETGPTGIWRAR